MAGSGRMLRFKIHKSPGDIDAVLRYLVRTAFRDVPFYRRATGAAGVCPARFRGIEDLPLLPVTTKFDLLARGLPDRLAARMRPRRMETRVTSGMSGQDLVVHMSRTELAWRKFTLISRMWRDAGRTLPMSLVQLGAWIPPELGSEIQMRRTPFGWVTHISRRLPIQQEIDALLTSRATVITSCPSTIEVVASEVARLGVHGVRPAIVVTRGEILRPQVRALLSDIFACRVTDYYSAEEIGLIAWQCPSVPEIMHVNQDACVVEVLDDEAHPAPAGEEGTVAVTNLFNLTMPLIRYALGDRTTIVRDVPSACRCDPRGSTILAPAGRSDDFVVLPDTQRISPRLVDDIVYLGCVAHGLDGEFSRSLRDYQIVQDSPSRITVKFLTNRRIPDIVGDVIGENLRKLHPDLEHTVVGVSEIASEGAGKRRRVISNVSPATSPHCEVDP